MFYASSFSYPTTNRTRATDAERTFLASRKNVPFFASLLEQVQSKGTLSPKQHAALAKFMAASKDLGNAAADAYEAEIDRANNLADLYAAEQARKAAAPTPGIYSLDGVIYLVKQNKAKTNVYAKRLVPSAERMNENGDAVRFDFEYEQGAINRLSAANKMPFEEAQALSIKYGRCLNCNRVLTAGSSVYAGIGPVCAKKMGAVL
jgi:hypothetical protein